MSVRKITLLIMFFIIYSCNNRDNNKLYKIGGITQGTTYSILYLKEKNIKSINEDIEKIFVGVDSVFSIYRENSEILQINRNEYKLGVSKEFQKIFLIAKEMNTLTDGLLDPTVGILIKNINFNNSEFYKEIDKKQFKKYIGFHKVKLENNNLFKEYDSIFMDFNSLVKGYTVDIISKYLESKNVNNYLVEIGGEVKAKGKKRGEEKWKVGIDSPIYEKGKRELIYFLDLDGISLATSGNYRKYKIDSLGNKYVHTINPLDLDFSEGKILSISVLHKDCVYADAFATALISCKKIKKVKDIASKNNLEIYAIYIDENNEIKEYKTELFKKIGKNL